MRRATSKHARLIIQFQSQNPIRTRRRRNVSKETSSLSSSKCGVFAAPLCHHSSSRSYSSKSHTNAIKPWATEEELRLLSVHLKSVREKAAAASENVNARSKDDADLVVSTNTDKLCAKTFREYNPELLAKHFQKQPFKVLKRMYEIVSSMTFVGVRVYFKVGDTESRAKFFRDELVKLGPAFVKFGQVLSTREDVLPREYCEQLAELQDSMAPSDLASSREFLKLHLECEPEAAFATFDPTPIAAASLAQVYKATLVGSGKAVAVKLQRPEAFENVALDSYVLRLVAKYSAKNPIKKFNSDVVRIVDELVGRLFEEMDYEREAKQCNRFRETYQDGKIAGRVRAPVVVDVLSTSRVLTMEFVQGERIDGLQKLYGDDSSWELDEKGGKRKKRNKTKFMKEFQPHEILRRGVRCSLHQLLATGFMHADPHPGNLIVDEQGALVYLDFGTCVYVPQFQRRAMIRGLIGFVNRDAESLVSDLKTLDFLPEDADDEACVQALTKVFDERGNRIRDSNDFMAVITQLTEALLYKGFRLPPTFARVLRALAALEGTAQAIDPNFKVLEQSYPYVLARVTSDRSPEMRSAVRRLLLDEKSGKVRWARLRRLVEAYAEKGSEVSGEFHTTRMSKSGARNRKNTTKSLDDDDDDDDFSFDLKEEDDGESKRSSYLNDFDRARGVTKAEKLRRENAFEYFRDFSRKSAKGVKTLVEDVFCSSSGQSGRNHRKEEETTFDDEYDEEEENQTDTSSESPAVDAVEDALRFLFSKDGKIVRDNVVEDALDALEAFFDDDSDDDDHPKDDTDTFDVNDVEKKKTKKKESVGDQITLDQLLLAFKATRAATADRPDLWIPAVGKYVFEKESADMACMFLSGMLERAPRKEDDLKETLTSKSDDETSRFGGFTDGCRSRRNHLDVAEIARRVIHAATRKTKKKTQ